MPGIGGIVDVRGQIERLVALGVPDFAGISAERLRRYAAPLMDTTSGTVAVHPDLIAPSLLAGLMERDGRRGFVVEDLTDLDGFVPIDDVEIPEAPLYLVHEIERGDELRDLSPDEALGRIRGHDRSPLTIAEGIGWLLQEPDRLEPNYCFMTIGSRRPKAKGLDARTPAIWISGGTGRDGAGRRGAPKVGWCWAGNRHTWLGFASAAARSAGERP